MAKREKGYESAIALVYHVDYWDNLGWKDPFGSKQMTEAQNLYATPLKIRGMYTPMVVVSGAMHTSNLGEASKKIADGAKTAPVATVEASGKRTGAGATVEAQVSVQQDEKRAVEVTIAAAENNLTTEVKAGENKGKTFTEHGVVRFLSKPAAPGKDGKVALEVPLGKNWKTENVYLAIIVRDAETKQVLGAKRLEWKDLTEAKK